LMVTLGAALLVTAGWRTRVIVGAACASVVVCTTGDTAAVSTGAALTWSRVARLCAPTIIATVLLVTKDKRTAKRLEEVIPEAMRALLEGSLYSLKNRRIGRLMLKRRLKSSLNLP
jgi:hypothetical protein